MGDDIYLAVVIKAVSLLRFVSFMRAGTTTFVDAGTMIAIQQDIPM